MLRAMVLIYWILAFGTLNAQNQVYEVSYSGVYRGEPLFIQNPYNPSQKSYCIQQIIVNDQSIKLNYSRSALMLNFESVPRFTPISIHIKYGDSLCIPSLVNPDAIRYHSVFGYENVSINDSSIVWSSKGEHAEGIYTVEKFNLGYWEPVESIKPKGVFGGSEYVYYPTYEDGANKFRIKYHFDGEGIESPEVEYVFYPEPITFQRDGNRIILSRACSYVVNDSDNNDVIRGSGKEIDITPLGHGEFYFIFNEEQIELFRKNDRVKVFKKAETGKSDN